MTATEAVMDVEKRFWEESDSAEFFQSYVADDAVIMLPGMGVLDKDQAVQSTAKGGGWTDVQMSDVRTSQIADGVVSLAYTGQAKGPDGKPYKAAIGSVYVDRNGRWQLAFTSHQTIEEKSE